MPYLDRRLLQKGYRINLMRNTISPWIIFIKERFHPASHFLMITLFFIAHYLVADSLELIQLNLLQSLFLYVAVFLFFLKLRFYDEIKDYDLDVIINPTRPLPRGLLAIHDLKKAICVCIFFEIIIFSLCGISSFIAGVVSISYSLLMYKEFYIPRLIRPHLTTYAMTHTIVTILLSLTIFSSLTSIALDNLNINLFYFSFMSWFLFNIFEFGRKIFLIEEERNQVESYSKVFSKPGAILLVISQAILASYCVYKFMLQNNMYTYVVLSLTLALLILSSIYFLISKSNLSAKIYRGYSSGYIVLNYLFIIINYILY